MSAVVFLLVRVLHVLLAGVWIGSNVFTAVLLTPAVEAAGPSGGQVMSGLSRRGLVAYMAVAAGMTVLTGLYLIWRFTGGFDPAVTLSRTGLVFATGGTAGILAAIVGAVIGRNAVKVETIMKRVAGVADADVRSALLREAAAARQHMKTGGKVVIALQALALTLMTVGHYV